MGSVLDDKENALVWHGCRVCRVLFLRRGQEHQPRHRPRRVSRVTGTRVTGARVTGTRMQASTDCLAFCLSKGLVAPVNHPTAFQLTDANVHCRSLEIEQGLPHPDLVIHVDAGRASSEEGATLMKMADDAWVTVDGSGGTDKVTERALKIILDKMGKDDEGAPRPPLKQLWTPHFPPALSE